MQDRIAYQGITFDDVLLEPGYSDVLPRQVDVRTRLTRNITLNLPILSSPMDTVTESDLAIALAQEGGLGVIHKNLTIADQTREVDKVKRSENGIIVDPITLPPDESVGTAKRIMQQNKISGVPITVNGFLKGILTRRDLRFLTDDNQRLAEVMTHNNLVTAAENTTLEAAERILTENKVEKLLLVDDKYKLKGLITIKDIDKLANFPNACKDGRGRLRVGAAVGVHEFERVESLIRAGVDVIVVDSAHGHTANVIQTVAEIKRRHKIDVIAGNVATVEGARALLEAGADAIKVGIGPGSICTTRVISGVGVPQITAIAQSAKGLGDSGTPIIADGGIRYSGDIVKALAAGANCVMLGSLLAGLSESPGQLIIYKGRSFKTYRGMGSIGAMMAGSKDRYRQESGSARDKLVPEGVEGRVPYKGPLAPFIYQLVGGLRAGMGYCGTRNIEELRTRTRFIMVSAATVQESHPHDIAITQEAPNYSSRAEYANLEGDRYAWPLAVLAALAACGFASAQQRPALPPQPLPLPVQYTLPTPPAATFSTGAVQQVGAQPPRPAPAPLPAPVPGPSPADTASSEYEELLRLPDPSTVFKLESEEAFRVRLQNKANDLKRGERLEFPKPQVLAKGRYAGRTWPEMHCTAEPNYVCYEKLLFEQKNFERYGWELGPITPVMSAMAFYADFWLIPYNLATDPFRAYECSAGYCMPGDPVPLLLYPPEMSASGALAEAAAVLTLVVMFP